MDSIGIENGNGSPERGLAQIESDLLEAERALVDADARLEAAKRERLAALEKINQCQIEFDGIVAERRQSSTPGTKWHRELVETKDALVLSPKDVLAEDTNASDGSAFKVVRGQFDRLSAHVKVAGPNSE